MSRMTTATIEHGQLLNIKQAAALLNVSEVSLRRWTDSGRLACVRIGAKRERRFRRGDLLAFLEEPAGSSSSIMHNQTPGADGHRASLSIEGITIDYGSHLCAFYESDLGRLKLAVPYLADGLRTGDLCYLVASREVQETILENLREVYAGVDAAVDQGRLALCDGMPSVQKIYEYFERSFVMAMRSGGQALRVLGDMAWFLDEDMGVPELVEFETRYNHSLAHQFPVVSLCQYDARRFSGMGVVNALKCHEDTFKHPFARFLGV
ncbi:MAG: MEDS domain-containing protein [Gammaproteobacteria bacterium]|nr:MEDS domain-containing protein [Gammaproteobacteria bacterium]